MQHFWANLVYWIHFSNKSSNPIFWSRWLVGGLNELQIIFQNWKIIFPFLWYCTLNGVQNNNFRESAWRTFSMAKICSHCGWSKTHMRAWDFYCTKDVRCPVWPDKINEIFFHGNWHFIFYQIVEHSWRGKGYPSLKKSLDLQDFRGLKFPKSLGIFNMKNETKHF